MDSHEIIRYGEIIADDDLCSMHYDHVDFVRIMIVKYEGNIYYIKRVNDEDEEIQVIGYERYEKE